MAESASMLLECEIGGDLEINGPAGNDFSIVSGTAVVRRQDLCTTDPCWFAVESLELNAPMFKFQIVDAFFEWDEYDLLLTSDLGDCTCLNCI